MTYKADCAISQPKDQGSYRNRRDLGGFGWHPDRGIFIPVVSNDDIPKPYATGMNPKQIIDPNSTKQSRSAPDTVVKSTLPAIDYNYRP